MKRAAVLAAIAVSMMISSLAWADNDPPPLIIENQLAPADRITLGNGAVQVVTSVALTEGKWTISGGATVQATVNPNVRGQYLYTLAAFTSNPNQLPVDGSVGLDARPYGTWWFAANPKPHTILVGHNGATVYLVVEYYGQTSAELVQAFGSIIATNDIGD